MTAGQEAREHERAQARIKVEFHFGSTTGIGHTTDISEGGMFLATKRVAQPGTRVYLRIHLPGAQPAEPLKIIGIVARVVKSVEEGGHAPEGGMGIHFEVAYARTREHLGGFVDGLLHDGPPAQQPRNTPTIQEVPGSTQKESQFAMRFPVVATGKAPSAQKRPLTAAEVNKAFAFKSVEPGGIDWAKIQSIALKVTFALVLLGVAGWMVSCINDLFQAR